MTEETILTQAEESAAIEADNKSVKKGLSSYSLKWIAIVTMFIDHAAAIFIERYLLATPNFMSGSTKNVYYIYMFLRSVGRIAFPIFIFLLVQGFEHTRSKAKYALRLFLFAFISEVPFDMGFNNSFFDMSYQNVFFTLFLGFLFMWFADFLKDKELNPWAGYAGIVLGTLSISAYFGLLIANILFNNEFNAPLLQSFICATGIFAILCVIILIFKFKARSFNELCIASYKLLAVGILMFAADNLHTDYSGFGVLAIALAYTYREDRKKSFLLCMASLIAASTLEAVALLDWVFLKKYNGNKGKSMKYFFYAFYPAHIGILAIIAHFVGL